MACGEGGRQRCLFPHQPERRHRGAAGLARGGAVRTITLGSFCWSNAWAVAFARSLGDEVFAAVLQTNVSGAETAHVPPPRGAAGGGLVPERFALACSSAQLTVPEAAITPANVDAFARFARESGSPYPLTYDHVVLCLGWRHDTSIYDTGARGRKPVDSTMSALPAMQPNGKYPVLTEEYESVNVPGLYFAGGLAHGKDFRRSAGGFVHGLRYTARALFRTLEAKLEAVPWPETAFAFGGRASDLPQLHALVALAIGGAVI
jgi:hypothetical protein